jgi:photosystem II stability/assembly factor-like uncharacterized protein
MKIQYFVVGYLKQDKLFKTTDGGTTWSPSPISFPPIWVVKFYNENIGIVLTYDFFSPPKLNRTTNGGNTWETFNLPSIDAIPRDIEFVPGYPNKVWSIASVKYLDEKGLRSRCY